MSARFLGGSAGRAWRHCLIAAALLLLAIAPQPVAAQQSAGDQTITAIVAAGSVGNSVNIIVTNANSWAGLGTVTIGVPQPPRYVTNLAIDPPRIDGLDPNATREVTVTFDIVPDVPDAGARETITLQLDAVGGILDAPRLALQLGIETPKSRMTIVPFVVGERVADAREALQRRSLAVSVERAERPADPALYDTVVAQATPAGAIVPVGQEIGLTAFPPGIIRVPRVAGLTVEDATRLVSRAGLTPRVSPLGDAPSEQQANRVDTSQPAENETAEPGAIVALLAYGPYRAPALPGDQPATAPGGAWGQPWRGEIKLTLIVADGETMSLAAALARYLKPKPKPEAGAGGGILAVPGAIASSGADAIGEAIAETIGVVFKALDVGMPMSFVLAEEQGGFRLRVPGSSKFVDEMNASLAQFVPLLLPAGGGQLRASKTANGGPSVGDATVAFELTASPDWQQITIKVSVKAANLKMDMAPRSLELALIGTAKPGLYSAASYEGDVMALIGRLMPH